MDGFCVALTRFRDAMNETEDVVTPLKAKLDEFGELLSKVRYTHMNARMHVHAHTHH